MNKQIEALKLALDALEYIHEGANNQGPHTGISWRCVSNKAEPAITALRDRLAQPQQAHEINADEDAIGMAIQDTFVCGTGVLKLWLDGGKMQFDHVPIKDFNVFGDELKWRAAHTGEEKHND